MTNILKRILCRHEYEILSSSMTKDAFGVPHIITTQRCSRCGKITTDEVILRGDANDWIR